MPGLGAALLTFTPDSVARSADVNANFSALNGALTPIFTSVTLSQPPILAGGNQETGFLGVQGISGGSGSGSAMGVGVNFKTQLANTPTSISFAAPLIHNNDTSHQAGQLTQYGFFFNIYPTSSGAITYWIGLYTTVGNCLLAVDADAGTFDHHCDHCRAVALDVPLSALSIAPLATHTDGWWTRLGSRLARALRILPPVTAPQMPDAATRASLAPNAYSLSYRCPQCGAVECFNTALTEADEADTTPLVGHTTYFTTQGEQAARIRALQRALGLPVVGGVVDAHEATKAATAERPLVGATA